MPVFRTAYIYVRNIYAGVLCETDEGYTFTYDTEYLNSPSATAVSLTLPLQSEPYLSKTLFSFFDGLIPEGWLLKVVSRNWKIDSHDRFGILLVACKDGGENPPNGDDHIYSFSYNGVNIAPGDSFAEIQSRLGNPTSYFEAASCAFDGNDKIYTYGGS